MSRIAGRQDRQDGFSILPILPLCDPAHLVLSSIEILQFSEKIKLIHYTIDHENLKVLAPIDGGEEAKFALQMWPSGAYQSRNY
jgi:hypothetical protein